MGKISLAIHNMTVVCFGLSVLARTSHPLDEVPKSEAVVEQFNNLE
jgi:hypothetical protein